MEDSFSKYMNEPEKSNCTDENMIVVQKIMEITARGNNAEIKRNNKGELVVYEVWKKKVV